MRLLLTTLALASLGASAHAGFWTFNNLIDGTQEVPPSGSPGIGNATGNYDDVTNVLNITVIANGIPTAITAAHIHGAAPPGVNAGVQFNLGVGAGGGNQYQTINQFVLSAQQENDLLAGLYYVNIHSQQFPGGEIRGQLNPVPEPATMAALGMGALVLMRRRRKSA